LWTLLSAVLLAGVGVVDVSAEPYHVRWTYYIGEQQEISGAPALDREGNVYFAAGTGYLYKVDRDGTLEWKYKLSSYPGDNPASPSIGPDNTIYYLCNYRLYAFNPDGTKKWEFKASREARTSTAIGPDGVIYFGDGDNFYAINPDGAAKWTKEFSESYYFPRINIAPAIAEDGTIYTALSGNYNILFALNPADGSTKWQLTLASTTQQGSSFAIGADGTLYFGTGGGILYAVNPDGATKWTYNAGENEGIDSCTVFGGPAIGGNTIYFPLASNSSSGRGAVIGLNLEGERFYKCTRALEYGPFYDIYTTPAIGHVGAIYFGEQRGGFFSISSTQGGYTRWEIDTDGGFMKSSPAVSDDGWVYFGTWYGTLYCVSTIDSNRLADTPWPRYGLNNQNTHCLAASVAVQADFVGDPLAGNAPLTVQFTDKSTGAITSWSWDFGDGETSTDQNPSHTYANHGTYTVALTVENTTGPDTETKTDYITVSQGLPVPDIVANGSDGPVVLPEGDPVSVTISLEPGEFEGYTADWWVAVNTPFAPPGNWYTYVHPTGWKPGINLCVQSPLFQLGPTEVLSTTLPVGQYTFYFALDEPTGVPEVRVFDSVQVQVTP